MEHVSATTENAEPDIGDVRKLGLESYRGRLPEPDLFGWKMLCETDQSLHRVTCEQSESGTGLAA